MIELAILYFLLSGYIFYLAVENFLKNKKNYFHQATSLLLFCISMLFIVYFLKGIIPDSTVRHIVVYVEFPLYVAKTCIMVEWFRLLTKTSLYLMDVWKRWGIYIPFLLLIPLFPIDNWFISSINNHPFVHYIEFGPLMYIYAFLFIVYSGYIFSMLIRNQKSKANTKYPLHYFQAGFALYFIWTVFFGFAAVEIGAFQDMPLLFIYGDLFLIAALRIAMEKYNFLPAFEKRYQILFEESPIAIILINEQLQLKDVNKQAEVLFRENKDALIRESLKSFLPKDIFLEFRKMWSAATESSSGLRNYELTLPNWRRGKTMHLVLDSQFINLDNRLMQYVMIQDVTVSKNTEQEVLYFAYHDSLTGLSNRRSFQQKMEAMLESEQSISLILLDLDDFKRINDTFGHHIGDEVIKHAASLLHGLLPEQAKAARLGGDEFAVLLPGTISVKNTVELVERFIEKLKDPYIVEELELHLSCSIGMTWEAGRVIDSGQLLIEADRAMYEAKREGKSAYKIYREQEYANKD